MVTAFLSTIGENKQTKNSVGILYEFSWKTWNLYYHYKVFNAFLTFLGDVCQVKQLILENKVKTARCKKTISIGYW